VVEPTHLKKNMLVKMSKMGSSSPKFGMKEKKMFENHIPRKAIWWKGSKKPHPIGILGSPSAAEKPALGTNSEASARMVLGGTRIEHNIHPRRLTWNLHITHEKKGK